MIAIHRRRVARPVSAALALTVASVIAAGCGSSGSSGGTAPQGSGVAGQSVPTANLPVLKKIGKGEGQLNLIAWEGYLEPDLGQAVRAADRLPGQREIRRQLR